eukprot:342398_1
MRVVTFSRYKLNYLIFDGIADCRDLSLKSSFNPTQAILAITQSVEIHKKHTQRIQITKYYDMREESGMVTATMKSMRSIKSNANKPLQQRLKHNSSNKKSSHTQFTNDTEQRHDRHVTITCIGNRRQS